MPSGQKRHFMGGQTGELTLDATTATQYTDPIWIPHGSVFSFQLDWQSVGDDLAATGELQETCIPNPDLSDDGLGYQHRCHNYGHYCHSYSRKGTYQCRKYGLRSCPIQIFS